MIVCISIAVLLFVGSFSYLKTSPPLIAGTLGYQKGKEVLLVEVGNQNSFGRIEIQEVLVNNNINPSIAKMQVSNHSKGFIISDKFNSEEVSEYAFKNLENVQLEPNTAPQEQLKKVNEGTSTEGDWIYAITLGHKSSIEKVIIKYQYLGLSYEKVVTTN